MKKIITIIMVFLPFAIFGSNHTVIHNFGSSQIEPDAIKLSEWMPWVVALLIAILSNALAWWQITTTKKMVKDQIDASKKIAIITHNSSIVSNNRMEYLKELRESATEMVYIVTKMSDIIKREIETKTIEKSVDRDNIFDNFTKLSAKIQILLNPNEELTKGVYSSMQMMLDGIESQNRGRFEAGNIEFMNYIKQILKKEWEKIKAIED